MYKYHQYLQDTCCSELEKNSNRKMKPVIPISEILKKKVIVNQIILIHQKYHQTNITDLVQKIIRKMINLKFHDLTREMIKNVYQKLLQSNDAEQILQCFSYECLEAYGL